MVDIVFAKAFRRHVECPEAVVAGATVAEALGAYFELHPAVRGYVLDEAGAVRRHVAVFHNNDLIADRENLTDRIEDGDRIHLFQALSGG